MDEEMSSVQMRRAVEVDIPQPVERLAVRYVPCECPDRGLFAAQHLATLYAMEFHVSPTVPTAIKDDAAGSAEAEQDLACICSAWQARCGQL
jgi:hypothetical protein